MYKISPKCYIIFRHGIDLWKYSEYLYSNFMNCLNHFTPTMHLVSSKYLVKKSLWITGGHDNTIVDMSTSLHIETEIISIGDNGTMTVQQGSDLPIALFRHAMVSINDTLAMVIGGLSSDLFSESALTYWYEFYLIDGILFSNIYVLTVYFNQTI